MEENTVTADEDTVMEDCDGQNVVTMMDVLKEQEDFENNANAVLGASDEKNCTYSKGYIKRQAIYACLTCCSEAKDDPLKRAGVCLACSLTCHENHELIELYTKRNFRCDCGNPKFNSNPCQYTTTKTELNENNVYSQNFSGLYCVCHRPYPDPESTIEDEMIQCIICEDWLHATHLEATVPSNDQYSEMICKGCMEKNSFLHDYSSLAVNVENDVDAVHDTTEITNLNGNHIKANEENSSNMNDKKDCTSTATKASDTTKEEDECMEEDRLLADPEEENKKVESALKNDELNKGEDQPSSERNGDVTNNVSAEKEDVDNMTGTELSTSNEKEETDTKVEAQVDQDAEKTNQENDSVNNDVNTEMKNTEDKEEKISSNDLEVDTEKKNEDVSASNTNDSNSDSTLDEREKNTNIDIKHKTDMVVENTNEDTNKSEDTKSEHKRKLSIEETNVDSTITGKRVKLDSCCIRPKNVKKMYKGATFWPSDFRQKLCTCNECLSMYKDLSVLFLTDIEDTVTAYESLGEEKERIEGKPASQYEKGLQALSSLDRVQQINALTEYNKMKDKLLDFLKTFKERKEVVKEEDIKEFFAGMKPKREPDGVYFCR